MGVPPPPLGRLLQGLIILTLKSFFFIPRWNLSQCSLYLLPCLFSMWLPGRGEPPVLFAVTLLSTGALCWGPTGIFSRVNRLNTLRLSSQGRFSSTLIVVALLWTLSSLSSSLWIVGTRTGHRAAGAAWQVLSKTPVTRICTQKWLIFRSKSKLS